VSQIDFWVEDETDKSNRRMLSKVYEDADAVSRAGGVVRTSILGLCTVFDESMNKVDTEIDQDDNQPRFVIDGRRFKKTSQQH